MLPQNDSLVIQYAGLSSALDPGSGAFLTPGSGKGFFPEPGSRIPDPKPYFTDKVLGKKFYTS